MQAAWLAFLAAGRPRHPRLRVIFSMLAGLAPLHAERLSSRGGPGSSSPDPLLFYDTSSYGPAAVDALECASSAPSSCSTARTARSSSPAEHGMPDALDWEQISEGTRRALGASLARCSHDRCARRQHRGSAPLRGSDLAGDFAVACRGRAAATSSAPELEDVRRASSPTGPSCGSTSSSTTPRQRRLRGAAQRRAPHRLADLLDGRPRHGLPRPRRLRRRRRGRQRRRARGAPRDRRTARAAAPVAAGRASTSPPADIHRVRHAGIRSRRHAARLLAAAAAHGRLRDRRGRRARAPHACPRSEELRPLEPLR